MVRVCESGRILNSPGFLGYRAPIKFKLSVSYFTRGNCHLLLINLEVIKNLISWSNLCLKYSVHRTLVGIVPVKPVDYLWEVLAKIGYFREFRHLRRGMLKWKRETVALNVILKSQELYPEGNQYSEIQDMRKGKYFGYAVWITEFLQALKLRCQCFCWSCLQFLLPFI